MWRVPQNNGQGQLGHQTLCPNALFNILYNHMLYIGIPQSCLYVSGGKSYTLLILIHTLTTHVPRLSYWYKQPRYIQIQSRLYVSGDCRTDINNLGVRRTALSVATSTVSNWLWAYFEQIYSSYHCSLETALSRSRLCRALQFKTTRFCIPLSGHHSPITSQFGRISYCSPCLKQKVTRPAHLRIRPNV